MPINVNLYYVHNKQNTHTLQHSITFQDYMNLETVMKNAGNLTIQEAQHHKATQYIALK
jgi:hypothetical protein